MNRDRPRLDALTGVRYLAAMGVFIAHVGSGLPASFRIQPYLMTLTTIAMPLFFVLSGFLMAYNYSDSFRSDFWPAARRYFVARFARIYPIYVVVLLLYFSFVGNFFNDLKYHRHDTLLSLSFVGTMTQGWFHQPVFANDHHPRTICLSYMAVAWSVSVEVFFYLVFPFVVWPIIRRFNSLQNMLIGVGVVFAIYVVVNIAIMFVMVPSELLKRGGDYSLGRWIVYLCPYMRLGEFMIGAMAGQYLLARQRQENVGLTSNRDWWRRQAALIGSVALLLGLAFWLADTLPESLQAPNWIRIAARNILCAPFCALAIYLLAVTSSRVTRLLGSKVMVQLGEASYCIYLAHPIVQSFYLPRTLGEGDIHSNKVIIYNHAAMFVVLHIFCLGLYHYIEEPCRKWIRNRFAGRSVVSAHHEPIVVMATTQYVRGEVMVHH